MSRRRPADDRGIKCGVAEKLPPGAVDPGVGGGTPVPVWIPYYAAVGALAGAVALLWLVVIDPKITALTGYRTGAYGAAALAGVSAIAGDALLSRRLARRRWARFSELHLKHGGCPSCGYALAHLPTDQGGMIVCPECNAAWRADRLTADDTPRDAPLHQDHDRHEDSR